MLGNVVVLFLVFFFLRNFHIIHHSGCINLHSHQVRRRESPFSTSSPAFIVCTFFDDGHSDFYEVKPHGGFDLHFSKQRHCFDSKDPSSQGYGFSSSHIWMWELDCKESWAPKNWCFWTVVLEKTLESPLDCKEIQPVRPKGDQSWVFIGRTDVEAETPILWPPDAMNWLIWKDAGKWIFRTDFL